MVSSRESVGALVRTRSGFGGRRSGDGRCGCPRRGSPHLRLEVVDLPDQAHEGGVVGQRRRVHEQPAGPGVVGVGGPAHRPHQGVRAGTGRQPQHRRDPASRPGLDGAGRVVAVVRLVVEPAAAEGGLGGTDHGGQRLGDHRPEASSLPEGEGQHTAGDDPQRGGEVAGQHVPQRGGGVQPGVARLRQHPQQPVAGTQRTQRQRRVGLLGDLRVGPGRAGAGDHRHRPVRLRLEDEQGALARAAGVVTRPGRVARRGPRPVLAAGREEHVPPDHPVALADQRVRAVRGDGDAGPAARVDVEPERGADVAARVVGEHDQAVESRGRQLGEQVGPALRPEVCRVRQQHRRAGTEVGRVELAGPVDDLHLHALGHQHLVQRLRPVRAGVHRVQQLT
nr:hypothetical protein [Serinicoccus marinus]